jgi:ubiquinone/menaquinone biosynthesis C-methylase UbiE
MADAGSYRAQGAAAAESEADRLRRQAAAVWTRERAALLSAGLERGQRLLDLGCGPGSVVERLAADLGRAPFGVDLNQDLLRRAGAGHFVRADGARLPFLDAVFDFVLVRLVLRHAPARERLLDEAARVLRTGGILCAVDVDEAATTFDPEPASWPALKAALAESAARRGGDPFVGRRLRRMLAEAGLTDLRTAALPVSTDDVPPSAFVETMLAPAARPIDPDLLDGPAAAGGWEELREWASRPNGFGYALGWMARARKPDGWRTRARA